VKQLLGGRKKLKMAAVAMETNVQNMLKNQPLTAQLHMSYAIPTSFHKV
jgi:hypothetical protein